VLTLKSDQKSADVELQITAPQVTVLRGITVYKNDYNCIEISLPSTDARQSSLTRLPPEQRERIMKPTFFEFIPEQISQRFLKLLKAG